MFKFLTPVIFASVLSIQCYALDQIVQTMGDQFVNRVPVSWKVEKGSWQYFDVTKCFLYGKTCFGNNPTSPYGYPVFGDSPVDDGVNFYRFDKREAVVLFFRTPPQMKYYGFTQYLYQRAGDALPVFASLSDTLNLQKIKTSAGVFDSYSAIVWTPDANSYQRILNHLVASGIPESMVNFIPMPAELPLYLGYGSNADTFGMLQRLALPAVPQNLKAYLEEKPFYVLKVLPDDAVEFNPAPIIGYADEISGYSEDSSLVNALNSLVRDINLKYGEKFTLNEYKVQYTSKTGWDCIAGAAMCNGDNHDALYSGDSGAGVLVKSLRDFVIIAGVNHAKTGKALYQNHTVYDLEKLAGIISVSDEKFTTDSALYHAGVTQPKDLRQFRYRNLYAYIIAYDCGGLEYCVEIPPPTSENPVGLVPGTPFTVVGRAYVDPRTGVRPAQSEIIKHRSFIGRLK